MSEEILQAQDNIIYITKKGIGFVRPPSKDLDLGIDWLH